MPGRREDNGAGRDEGSDLEAFRSDPNRPKGVSEGLAEAGTTPSDALRMGPVHAGNPYAIFRWHTVIYR